MIDETATTTPRPRATRAEQRAATRAAPRGPTRAEQREATRAASRGPTRAEQREATRAASRGPTRAEQREATRRALIEATGRILEDEGYAGLTTRRVAELAGVAQSTLMHHFETREALLVEAVSDLALRMAQEALEQIDLSALHRPEQREAVLDQAWSAFTSPPAMAVAQLWIAAWSEPELSAVLRSLERRLDAILSATASTLYPDQAGEPGFPALLATTVTVIQGLVMELPVLGRRATNARWRMIKPVLLDAARRLLD